MSETDVRMVLADKLRQLRARSGLSTNEVGDLIGKSGKTVSGWEHGRGQPDADMLLKLCEIYRVRSISEFFDQPAPEDEFRCQSADEVALLKSYRALNKASQSVALAMVQGLAGNPDAQKGQSSAAQAT